MKSKAIEEATAATKDRAIEEATAMTRDEAIEKVQATTEASSTRSDITQVERVEHQVAAKRYSSLDILAYIGQIGMYPDLF
jgi:hypothetical protein